MNLLYITKYLTNIGKNFLEAIEQPFSLLTDVSYRPAHQLESATPC